MSRPGVVLVVLSLLIPASLLSAPRTVFLDGGSQEAGLRPFFVNVSKDVGLEGVRGDSFAWGDYNNDGHYDLLVKGSRLFENTGPPMFKFREVTAASGLTSSGYAVWGDLNSDGYLDIFSAGHPYNFQDTVWLNTGPPDYSFENASALSGTEGIDDGRPSIASALGDLDRDGDLDAYVVNWRDDANVKYADLLWMNRGDGTFYNATEEAGIVDWNTDRSEPNAGMGVNMGDYNNDGWLDIYVSNYLLAPNYLFENQRDGTFRNVALEKGCAGEPTQGPTDTYYGHTAGSQWCDFDIDGDLDLWCSNLAHKDPYRTWICDNSELWRNDGEASGYSFTNIRDQTGIPTVVLETEELFFGIAWGDYDNDGDMDMWIPQIKSYLDYAYSFMFENQGDGTFVDVSMEVGMRVWDSDGGAWCDYDEDGDLDLITEGKYPYENGTYQAHLYRNEGVAGRHFLQVELFDGEGAPAIGARIRVLDPSKGTLLGMGEVEGGTAGHSYGPSFTQEFAFGSWEAPVDLDIRWPDGSIQFLSGVGLDRRVEVGKGSRTDLSVTAEAIDARVKEGEPLDLMVTVENIGASDVRSISLLVEEPSSTKGDLSGELLLGPLRAGELMTAELLIPTNGAEGAHALAVRLVDSYPKDQFQGNDISLLDVIVEPDNSPPRILGLELDRDAIHPDETAVLTVEAVDPDGDELEYSYSAEAGTLEETSPGKAEYRYPEDRTVVDSDTVDIMVRVADGRGGTDSERTALIVEERKGPPVIISCGISDAEIIKGVDATITIWAQISHPGPAGGIDRVYADLSEMGLADRMEMNDAGVDGDLTPLDMTYTASFDVPSNILTGGARVLITVVDADGDRAESEIAVKVSLSTTENPSREADTGDLTLLAAVGGMVLLIAFVLFLVVRVAGRIGRGRKK